jgi:hypothetical protein
MPERHANARADGRNALDRNDQHQHGDSKGAKKFI